MDQEQTLLEYKCPCCGGAIEFDAKLQKLKCPYCDTEFETETLKHYDDELKQDAPESMEWESLGGGEWKDGEADGLRSYICNSCGGEIVTDDTTAATACPYCGNPVVMAGNLSGSLRPDYVIPFKLDKKAAKEALKNHYKGKILMPKAFRDENRIDEIKGVYVPFWLFDADSDASIRYRATRLRHWRSGDYAYTETSHFALIRAGEISFERVPVDGSSKMADDLMESIEPFDFSEAVDFQTAYLAGYLADKYDVTAENSIERANDRIRTSTEQTFRTTTVGYTSVIPEHSSIKLNNGKAKYALYPVWILNTVWNGKPYVFAMNGQTGKFVGDLPLDKGAFVKWLIGLGLGISAVAFGLLTLLMA